MTPYYNESGITIYHGDARDIAPTLSGLIVTDPPYNVNYHYDEYVDDMPEAEYWQFIGSIVKPPLVFIHYPEALFPLSLVLNRTPTEIVAWIYHANTPKQWRAVAWFGALPDFGKSGQPFQNPTDARIRKLIGEGKRSRLYDWWPIEQVKNVSDEKTAHPCQIPLELMHQILVVTPFEGVVIDPFMGSGTTLVAAQRLGRQAVGIETSERYCAIAVERLRESYFQFED